MVRWRRCRMPARTADIVAFLDELLEIERFADLGPNGLQVPGAQHGHDGRHRRLRPARSCSSARSQEGAQLVLAHHGILWDFEPRRIGPAQAARLELLLANDIALAGYHLPLDAHPEHGNNALLAARSARRSHARAFPFKGEPIGVIARFDGDGDPRRRAVRARRRRHRRASRSSSTRARSASARSASSPAPPPTRSPRRSTSASTRSSPASRRST